MNSISIFFVGLDNFIITGDDQKLSPSQLINILIFIKPNNTGFLIASLENVVIANKATTITHNASCLRGNYNYIKLSPVFSIPWKKTFSDGFPDC